MYFLSETGYSTIKKKNCRPGPDFICWDLIVLAMKDYKHSFGTTCTTELFMIRPRMCIKKEILILQNVLNFLKKNWLMFEMIKQWWIIQNEDKNSLNILLKFLFRLSRGFIDMVYSRLSISYYHSHFWLFQRWLWSKCCSSYIKQKIKGFINLNY